MTSISRDLNDVSFPLRFTSRRHADQSRKWRMSLTKLKTAGFPMQITVSGLIKIIVEAGIYLSLLKIHFYAKNSPVNSTRIHCAKSSTVQNTKLTMEFTAKPSKIKSQSTAIVMSRCCPHFMGLHGGFEHTA